ncbi:MAG: flagellar hook-length control protein FliK [Paucibacter sp.]|nr:flagellar hook-length control protein FliK [Roseateles sp.]
MKLLSTLRANLVDTPPAPAAAARAASATTGAQALVVHTQTTGQPGREAKPQRFALPQVASPLGARTLAAEPSDAANASEKAQVRVSQDSASTSADAPQAATPQELPDAAQLLACLAQVSAQAMPVHAALPATTAATPQARQPQPLLSTTASDPRSVPSACLAADVAAPMVPLPTGLAQLMAAAVTGAQTEAEPAQAAAQAPAITTTTTTAAITTTASTPTIGTTAAATPAQPATTASTPASAEPAVAAFGPLLATTATPPATTGVAADALALHLTPNVPDSWQQPLMQALGDKLQVQIAARGTDQTVLHLAPPQLGRVEIAIRQQGGVLQVQMSATHQEVTNQLRQISEPLRHELVQRHAGDVSVQVSTGSASGAEGRGRETASGQSSGGGREQADRRAPARARDESDEAPAGFAQRMAKAASTLNG